MEIRLNNVNYLNRIKGKLKEQLKIDVSDNQFRAIFEDIDLSFDDNIVSIKPDKIVKYYTTDEKDDWLVILAMKQSYNWFDLLYGKDEVKPYIKQGFSFNDM